MKKTIFLVLLVLTLALLPVAGQATITTYTDQALFLADLAPGYYTNTFSTSGDLGDTENFLGNGFSYTLSVGTDTLWGLGNAISTSSTGVTISGSDFGSTGNPIAAIGGFFYLTDNDGNTLPLPLPNSADVTVNVMLNTTFKAITYSAPVGSLQFFGIIDDTNPITSLSVVIGGFVPGGYATISNLTVGALPSPVPVPPAVLLLGTGLLGLIGYRKKFAR